MMQDSEENSLNVSFGYKCNSYQNSSEANCEFKPYSGIQDSKFTYRSNSFSCLSGAALSANATLANTNMCNGIIGEEILPGLDSPKSFRRMASSPSFSRLDLLSSSQSSISTLGSSISNDYDMLDGSGNLWKSLSATRDSSSFLNAMDAQMAGGAAGEDRVQAVCSEESGWLFCGVYDGFNGRDAADFLAGTLYETIGLHLNMLQWPCKKERESCDLFGEGSLQYSPKNGVINSGLSLDMSTLDIRDKQDMFPTCLDSELSSESFRLGVLDCLSRALAQAECDFLYMVEQAMEDRPDLVSVGSCVLTVLLHGMDLYVLNLGDSRAVLASYCENGSLLAMELTETHSVDNKKEYEKMLSDHPDDPSPIIIGGRVKGKLRLTRAFGVGYLKKSKLNDALMGILRVSNLCSPPYIYTHPFTMSHRVSENDLFVVLGSDGLFDFFQNEEIVHLVHQFIINNPFGDPAKHLIEAFVLRAAESAGFSTEELMRVPAGRRRKYHDDVTIIVIILGNRQRTSTASTSL